MSEVDKFLNEYEASKSATPKARPRTEVDDFLDSAPAQKVGLGRSIADTGVAVGASLLTGGQLLANVAGADNTVAQGLGKASEAVRGFESQARREERSARARKIDEAEKSGSVWEEVKANVGAFAEAPIDTTLEALGTSAPSILASAVTRGKVPAVPVTMGAAQGVGAVKGSIYDAVENKYLESGYTPEEAAAAAAQAQSYGSDNAAQLALGGALGALAGGTGIESAAGRLMGRKAGDAASSGVIRSTAKGVAAEAPIEAMQGGQERLAANVALQNEGFIDTPTWRGVAGSAALEGLAGGAAGGGFGALEGFTGRQPTVDPLADATTDAPTGGDPTPNAPQAGPGMAPSPVPEQYRRETLGPDSAPLREPLPSEQMGIDPNTGPLSTAAAIAVDTGTSQQVAQQAAPAEAATVAALQASITAAEDNLAFIDSVAADTGWTQKLLDDREAAQSQLDGLRREAFAVRTGFNERTPEQSAAESWGAMNAYERNAAVTSVLGARGVLAKNIASRSWDALTEEQRSSLVTAVNAEQGQRWTDPNRKTADQDQPVLQNRDRSSAASIQQMHAIAQNPDYDKASYSRTFMDGAPVVLDEMPTLNPEAIGRSEMVTTAGDRRIPIQYAVIEAGQLLPSNKVDGSINPEYATGAEGKSRAIAGNGRVAGLTEAWRRGTADEYKGRMMADADAHGIAPAIIESMKQPVLVRLMPTSEATANIGDVSNTPGQLGMDSLEQAKTDMNRISMDGLKYGEDGEITIDTVMDFVRGLPETENLVSGGTISREARDRLEAAVFHKAYGNDELTRMQAERDEESRSIISALTKAAPQLARLEGAGVYDLRPLITEAATTAITARRRGIPLRDYVRQQDMGVNPAIYPILEMMLNGKGQIRSADYIGEQLINMGRMAHEEASSAGMDLFGERPSRTQEQVVSDSLTEVQGNGQLNVATGEAGMGEPRRAESDAPVDEGTEGGQQGPAETAPAQPTESAGSESGESQRPGDWETQNIGDSAVSDADGYKARSSDRLERINNATSKDEIDEILKEHASDPSGHVDGYSRMEAKAKDAKHKIDNPPRTDLVEGYTSQSPRQAQMDVDRLNETNPGHELVRMRDGWGEYYAIKKPSASQGKGQGPRAAEQADDPKRAKALARINSEKGAFFFSEQKAQAFIDSNGLSNEYTMEQQGRAFKVVPKSENAEPAAQIDTAANEAATSPQNSRPEPTEAQKEAGNYTKGHVRVQGLDVTVENPRGSDRSGTDPDGNEWRHTMSDHYGYIKRTTGADGEQVDAYIGPNPESQQVFIVDQIDQQTDGFDEHKVMVGFDSEAEATTAYRSNFDEGWKVGPVRAMSMDEFKGWLKDGDTTKPAAAPTVATGPSTSQAINDFIEGRRADAPAVEEVEREQIAQTSTQEAPQAAAAPDAETAAKDEDRFASNKLFTADKVAAARARMKSKFGQLNSGIDPEMLVDGMTIAGAYIESGVRNFTQYAKAMVEDLGDGVKPYLLSFWEGARNYPGLDTKDMTGPDESRRQFEALVTPEQGKEIAPEAVGEVAAKPKSRTRKSGARGDMVLTQDWGVEHIDGYGDSVREIGNDTKDAFLKESRNYLNAVSDALRAHGYEPHLDRKGKPEKPVSVNKSGAAGSGDITLTMTNPDNGNNVYIHIGDTSLRGVVPSTQSGIAVMYRVGTGTDRYAAKASNTWAPVDLSANELAQLISSRAQPGSAPADTGNDVSATAGTLVEAFYARLQDGTLPKDNRGLRSMVSELDGAEVDNARLKEAQESLEAAMARYARDIVDEGGSDQQVFDRLVKLYNDQPNLNIRTSTSVENQAYSTPAPLAYLSARLADIDHSTRAYEPTAGNGMLLITADPAKATANELEDTRHQNLVAQGFDAIQGDALDAIESGKVAAKSQDAIITNPPFGSVKDANGKATKVQVDGFRIGKIDHLIAAESLKAMKDNGKATLIIGADKVAGGVSTDDRIFFNWLYSNYNVTGHFEVDGKLYTRQGASWPVRVITINGRAKSGKVSPAPGTVQRYNNWDDVYGQFNSLLGTQQRRPDTYTAAGGATEQEAENDAGAAPTANAGQAGGTVRGGRTARGGARAGGVGGANAGATVDQAATDSEGVAASPAGQRPDERANAQDQLEPGDNRDTGAAKGDRGVSARTNAATANRNALTDAENAFQAKYQPRSARKDEGVLVPINMAQPLQDALSSLEDQVGDIDQYVVKELGYDSTEEMHDALMGLQVDSVASAIYQIKERGKGIIIADQTGIGKGRQAAALIRWAARNGHTPVFVTVKPALFTDMYGDLSDIGTSDVEPFIMNSDQWIAGPSGEKLFANKPSLHRQVLNQIAATGKLPEGRNALFMTYSQINTDNVQRRALSSLAPNAVFIMDESHNAGGESNTGIFMRETLEGVVGATYLSATYAKRPDNMPVYFKTDIGAAIADSSGLMEAMASGGLPLQTVVANNLVKAGQMFRRERSYDGVSIETKIDSGNRKSHERLSDTVTQALRSIVDADRTFHTVYFAQLREEAKKSGEALQDIAGNQASESVNHAEFSSVVHNFVRQLLLGLKADTAAQESIDALKRGEKPLIALENTMGSFLNEYAENNSLAIGDSMGDFDYRTVLSRALERTRYVVRSKANGEKEKQYIPLQRLDPKTRAAYTEAQAVIDGLDMDIPVSPIDWIRSRIEKAGFSVAEITGRNLSVDYSGAIPVLSQVSTAEQKDKVNTTRMFNDGSLDAIILNVSGSTGISLHASEKFADQKPRRMIVAQAAQDINIFMQMLGRVHRTGQVRLPAYTILNADLPAEKRPTALLNQKMKSLNANTSSNTESATSIQSADMLNKYGDQVIAAYLEDNSDLAVALGFESGATDSEGTAIEDLARKVTGRMALMPVQTQKEFYAEVEEQYSTLIQYLNDTNQNDLEPRTFDYEAEVQREEVIAEATDTESPFGQEAVYGEYRIKAQGKQMTPDEVREVAEKNLDGVTGKEHADNLIESLQRQLDAQINASGGADQETAMARATAMRDQAQIGRRFIADHPIGSAWRMEINGDIYNGVVVNVRNTHRKTGNPFSMSKTQVTLAVNGPLRTVTIPASQWSKVEIGPIHRTTLDTMFSEQVEGSEVAKIVTGNLLAAYGELTGSSGTIISFTKKGGEIEQGILLPKNFNIKLNTRGDFQFRSAEDVLKFLSESTNPDVDRFGVSSRDSVVRVRPRSGGDVRVVVPKSKARGGKFFLDKRLTDITGDFVSDGQGMVVNVPREKASDAVAYLMSKAPLYATPSLVAEARRVLGLPPAQSGNAGVAPKFSRRKEQTETAAFKRWFGESKVVDAQGKPLVVYHGSPDVRGIIDGGFAQSPVRGNVFFFTDSAAVAGTYADDSRAFDYQNAEPHVLPLYLSMQNPYVVDAKGARWRETERHIKEARDGGHDGIIIRNSRDEYNNLRDGGQLSTVYAVFEPTQVKSAATGNLRSRIDGLDLGDISNRGTFDPTNPDIRSSFAGRRSLAAQPMALETAQLRIAGGDNAETVRQETGWHRGNDGKWRYEISDDQAALAVPGQTFGDVFANAYANALADGRKKVTVADVLHHDELFAAYPTLAEIPVSEIPAGERALARLQRRATGMAIQVQPGMARSRVVSALLHEIQHGIQTIEGFATGGSVRRLISEADRTGAKTYIRLAGEVEARNTQARQGMTPDARRRQSPQETADVRAEDVIVTFNGTDMTNGPLPGNAETRPAMSQSQLLRAFNVQFPRLEQAVRTMLQRGKDGKRGGVVLVDSADPLLIARAFSKKTGRPLTETVQMFSEAGSVNGFYDPKSGLTFLVTPNLDIVTAPAVLLHEMTHGQQSQRLDKRALDMLMNRANVKNPELRGFLDRVANRMTDAGEDANAAEAAAYIVEQAVIEGRSQGYTMADSRFLAWADKAFGQRVGDFLRSFLGNIRSWMLRNGMKPGEVTVDDLVGYAMAGVQRAAAGRVDGGDVAFSQDTITNTPAFKSWFGDSKVVDENGKPLVVYHVTDADFSQFDISKSKRAAFGAGFYFTRDLNSQKQQATVNGAVVMPVYLSIQNPASINDVRQAMEDIQAGRFTYEQQVERGQAVTESLVSKGFDGVDVGDGDYVAFRPEQIKSTIGNVGAYGQRPVTADEAARSGMTQDEANEAQGRGDIRFSLAPPTESAAFKRWFGDSKVVDENGKPLVVHHGSGAKFTVFDSGKMGSNTRAESAREGFFFTDKKSLAEGFASEAQRGKVNFDEVARMIDGLDDQRLADLAEATRLSDDLELDGKEFFIEQVIDRLEQDSMSAPDDRFDIEKALRRFVGDEVFDTGSVLDVYLNISNPLEMSFAGVEDFQEGAIRDAIREAKKQGRDGVIFRGLEDAATVDDKGNGFIRSDVYVAFSPNQIKSATGNNGNFDPTNPDIRFSRSGVTDRAKAVGDAIKSVTVADVKASAKGKMIDWLGMGLQALGRRQLLDLYDKRLLPMAEYGRLVERMDAEKNDTGAKSDELARRWGKVKDSDKLADLMHDATLGRIDADSAIKTKDDENKVDAKALKDRFDKLSPDAKAIYREARDSYKDHHKEVIEAIKQRIERSEMQGKRKAELLKQMDNEFYKQVKGVYFPLARFGNYVVAVTGPDGKTSSVHRAETMGEANNLRAHLATRFPASQGYEIGKVTLGKEYVASRDSVGRGFMTELYGALGELNIPSSQMAELEDTLGQLYLSSLPDLSWARHGIHRKGTPGFSDDARRAFAQNMFHGARYLAKLRYGDLMQEELDAMQKYADARKSEPDYEQPKAQRVIDEMVKRHDSMMNPNSNPIATALTSFGFVYYLGLSPAAAAVNLSQTALVAYPIMGAKWGFKKSADALMKASAQAVKGKNDITESLTDEERKAYEKAIQDGTIDVTMAHDLAGIAQGEDAKVMWKIRPVMRLASFMFHQAEVFNRQVTFMASYRLAREAGESADSAYESAKKATYDGHFDYGAANRPRIMQGNVARVVLLFKQYAQNMMYTIARNAYQSVAGESPAVRKEARKVFGAIMGLHASAAGVLGLPLVGPLLALASALGGDDDDPWDAEVAMRNMLADAIGQKPAEVIARGFSRLGPADISGRVNLNNLLLPDVYEGLEGRRLAEAWTSAILGPVVGMGTNAAIGMQNISNGDYARGLESMLPIAVRNPIKAARYAMEGNVDRTGIVINDEVSWAGVGSQAVGFSPSEVRLAFEGRSAVFQADRALGERRSELMTQFARASMSGDQSGMSQAREAIASFNQKNPSRRIQANHLMQSVRNRQRRINQAEGGVYLPRNRRDVLDQGGFAGG